jgi:hypothetical protein
VGISDTEIRRSIPGAIVVGAVIIAAAIGLTSWSSIVALGGGRFAAIRHGIDFPTDKY